MGLSVCPECGLPTIETNWLKRNGEAAQHMDCVQARITLLRRKIEGIDDLACDAICDPNDCPGCPRDAELPRARR